MEIRFHGHPAGAPCTTVCDNWVTATEPTSRRVAFIGQPGSGKTELAASSGERDGTVEPVTEGEIPLPGFVGMLRSGRSDLAERAKDIARGVEEPWRAVDWDRPLEGAVGGRQQEGQNPEQQTQRD